MAADDVSAQYKNEKDASIPLDNFYIERSGNGILRKLISKLHFSLSTGVGQTYFKHDLSGYGILQNNGEDPTIFSSAQLSAGYSNWFNKVTPVTNIAGPGSFQVNSDTTAIGFKAHGFNIPLQATLHVEFNRYRIGGGFSFEYMHIGDFNPTSYQSNINSYSPESSSTMMSKYFLMLGASVYRYYNYVLVVDANIGGYNPGSAFDKSVISKGAYFNLGLKVERELSPNFRLFVRPSYEIKSFDLNIPESGSISHNFNALYLNFGATYRFPELRRCPIKKCHAQMNHAHGNKEYRSRVHPFYKNQNPHYGENYPVLIKYKGKNKNKLNPY